jgi:hypothetical protein
MEQQRPQIQGSHEKIYIIGEKISIGSFSTVYHCELQDPGFEFENIRLAIKITCHEFMRREIEIC